MKKTLIALATLAAVSGTAFAQSSVSLTGKLRFAYGEAKTAAGAKTTGVGVTDGDWNIAAVEDLGGGLKAGANMALRLRGRDNAMDAESSGSGARPRDSSMYLTGGFGTVTVGAIEAGNGILGLVTAGGPTYIGLDGYSVSTAGVVTNGVLSGASNTDILQYTSPAFSGFTVKAAALDKVGGGGAEATNGSQDATLFGVNYANGPLSAALDVTNYGLNSLTAGADSRTRVSANYNLGVAIVGAGYQTAKLTTGIARNETAVSVSAPFGAFNVGAIYATSKTDGVAGNNTGYDLAVQYNLSKRTYVALQAQSTKLAGATASATNTRVQLAHSF
ncbi:porin [Limnohabitans sp.]|uniref:porin n=1 Tax=Limnohabitans sp. TaxID=1907725 RepID=UPI00289F18E1|nr:porin [Limnohabitans sp.]